MVLTMKEDTFIKIDLREEREVEMLPIEYEGKDW